MPKVKELRGLIYLKYDSEAEFARALKWPRQRLHRITNGHKEPDLSEVDSIANLLDVSAGSMMDIFLRHKSPNGQRPSQPTEAE